MLLLITRQKQNKEKKREKKILIQATTLTKVLPTYNKVLLCGMKNEHKEKKMSKSLT